MPLTSETSRWKVGENALNGRKTVGNGGQRGGMDFSYSLFGRVRDSRHSSTFEIGVRRKWVTKRKKKKRKKRGNAADLLQCYRSANWSFSFPHWLSRPAKKQESRAGIKPRRRCIYCWWIIFLHLSLSLSYYFAPRKKESEHYARTIRDVNLIFKKKKKKNCDARASLPRVYILRAISSFGQLLDANLEILKLALAFRDASTDPPLLAGFAVLKIPFATAFFCVCCEELLGIASSRI